MMPFTEEHSCPGSEGGSYYLSVSGINQEQGKDILATTGTFLTRSASSW